MSGAVRARPAVPQHPHGNARGTHAWVTQHVWAHKLLLAVFVGSTLVAHLLSTLVPVYVGRGFAAATESGAGIAAIRAAAVTIAALVGGRFVADVLSHSSMEVVAQRVKRDARDELFRSLLGKRQSFHDRQHVGDILARAINDARLVDYMLSPGLATAFNGAVAVAVPMIFIFTLDPMLLLAPTVLVVVFTIALLNHVRRLHPLTEEMRTRFASLNESFSETLAGMTTVKASTQEPLERARFEGGAQAYRDAFVRRGRAQAIYLPALSLGLGMSIGAVHSLALLAGGRLDVAEVVTYLGWLALFALPITMSEQSVPVIQEGYVAAARMKRLTEQDPDESEIMQGGDAAIEGSVTFEDVSFTHGGAQLLQDITFHLPVGGTLAVVGPTGSGKSVLTKLINRTYDPTSGRILIDGRDVRTWHPRALRRQIANVHQDAFLFSKSVMENLAFGSPNGVRDHEVRAAARRARADEFVRSMENDYDTVLNEGGTTLSGGERQRLVIARALLADPRILVLDDATSAVDARTESAIDEAITTLMRGRTTILISHRPNQIRRADLILLLEGGRVVDQGTHGQLMTRCPLYRRIYATAAPEQSRGAPRARGGGANE